ncbi:hypothetical protein LXL04_028113 [Taraxacum kok-saghyz]
MSPVVLHSAGDQNANPETRVDDVEFEENEVYAIDIVTSTGDGKPKLFDEKQTTIYKRAVDKSYHLKLKASRFIFRHWKKGKKPEKGEGEAMEEDATNGGGQE